MREVDGLEARVRDEYAKALRGWHVAWQARVEWHRERFYPPDRLDGSLLYPHVLDERQALRDAEERAWDRVLQAHDVLREALSSRD